MLITVKLTWQKISFDRFKWKDKNIHTSYSLYAYSTGESP